MSQLLLVLSVIIISCVLLNSAADKRGIPVLLVFILFGILCGNIGLFPVREISQTFAEKVCTVALIFIMFYGGFGTRWKSAKPVALQAGLLASVGVIFTAVLVGFFCHYCLKWGWVESFLLGSVVSSTDAATVFSILRSHSLGLKYNTAPILEVESGSNDPFAYMMTIMMLSIMNGDASAGHLVWLLVRQVGLGVIFGFVVAILGVICMRKINFATSGFDSLTIMAIALISYGLPDVFGGNGYLSAYIVGILMGNSSFPNRKKIISFFDGVTGLMQIVIFFILGLLVRLSDLHHAVLPAIAIFLGMLIVIRPAIVAVVMTPFRRHCFRQQLLVSYGGLRGASSIVFAIIAVTGSAALEHDIFNIVFCLVLLSISIQGFGLPTVARKLDMVDKASDVLKTFNDFSSETSLQFSRVNIDSDSIWNGKYIRELNLPKDIRVCRVVKDGHTRLVPNGNMLLEEGDVVIVCTSEYDSNRELRIIEYPIEKGDKWVGLALKDCPFRDNEQVMMIKRGDTTLLVDGRTVLNVGDVVYINREFHS